MMHWFGDYGHGMGHGFGWFFMIVFWVVIILLIVFLVKLMTERSTRSGPIRDAKEILRERYAKGEISKQEYDRMLEDIKR